MKKQWIALLTCGLTLFSQAQETQKPSTPDVKFPEFKKNLNEDGSHYIKFTTVTQFWSRYTDMNPNSKLNGAAINPFDIGIRRLRFSAFAQLTDRVFFYAQFGQNNLSYTTALQTGAFVHDAVGEYKVSRKGLFTLGTGLTGWGGPLRFSAPGVGSILGVDAPLYQQATNNVNDQFLRKLSVYAKGQIGRLDYRIAVSKPMYAKNALQENSPLNKTNSTFSLQAPLLQHQAYFQYQFFDKENNTLCYTTGTYHGKKKIFNIGAGWVQQAKANWILNGTDTTYSNMLLLGADAFLELPLSEKRNAITAYVAYSDYNFGKNYIRNVGVMNPSGGFDNTKGWNGNGAGDANGAGNTLPIVGTGKTLYTLVGYKFKDNLFKENGTLQPYASVQYSVYQALKDPMALYEGGVNWLINGSHNSKLTLGYQSRPIFTKDVNGDWKSTNRKGMVVLQYQVSF